MTPTMGLLAAGLLAITSAATAAPPDLQHCRYQTGIEMEADVCDALRRTEAADDARDAREAASRQSANADFERDTLQRDDTKRHAQALAAQVRAARQASELAAMRGRAAREDAADRAEAQRDNAAKAAAQARCGADYKAPRVGMPIARAQECVAPMRVAGQVNRADGVLTTYRSGSGAFFHVMNGLIVAWGR